MDYLIRQFLFFALRFIPIAKDNSCENPLDELKDSEEEEKQVVTDNIKSVYRKIAIQARDKGVVTKIKLISIKMPQKLKKITK